MSTIEPRPKRRTRHMIVHRTRPVIYKTCRTKADISDSLLFFAAAAVDVIPIPDDWTWTGSRWSPPEN
jgi:hypothetical protein